MTLRDIFLALSVPVLWGLGFTFSKVAVSEFPPILLMAFRFALTAALLVWFVPLPRNLFRQIFWIALVSAAIQYGLTFYGLKLLDASTAALVIQLEVPFLALLGAVLLKESVGWRRMTGIAIAFAGVVVIAGEPRLAGNQIGIFLCAAGAFTWALGQIMIRKLGTVGGFMLIAWVAVFATPQLFVASLVIEGNPIPAILAASWKVWAVILYLGIIMTAVGYGIWYNLIGRLPVNRVGPFLLLLPVVSITASVALLGETLTWWLVGGGCAIISGVSFIVFEDTRSK
jgi:O-acetylserine/cysteine efflux transporter